MKNLPLSPEGADILYTSLSMRKCLIETGDVSLSAADALEQNLPKKIKVLSSDQKALIEKIKKLMNECSAISR